MYRPLHLKFFLIVTHDLQYYFFAYLYGQLLGFTLTTLSNYMNCREERYPKNQNRILLSSSLKWCRLNFHKFDWFVFQIILGKHLFRKNDHGPKQEHQKNDHHPFQSGFGYYHWCRHRCDHFRPAWRFKKSEQSAKKERSMFSKIETKGQQGKIDGDHFQKEMESILVWLFIKLTLPLAVVWITNLTV